MGYARRKYVKEGHDGEYHVYNRCVRRAFLCGYDRLTGRDYSHRKAWVVKRLRFLATIFAIEVGTHGVMSDHYHAVLRVFSQLPAAWSDREVAIRWLTLHPGRRKLEGDSEHPSEEKIRALMDNPELIAEYRQRLCSLSWFMREMNEYIARKANKEDDVTGRFWESRYKCKVLLDKAAIAACMVYVDLNPIRAGIAATPEESDFTGIQERIRAWRRKMAAPSASGKEAQDLQSGLLAKNALPTGETSHPAEQTDFANLSDTAMSSDCWLSPISPDPERHGILEMTEEEYFDLVDKTGRVIRSEKRGAIDSDLAPILLRIGAKPEAWVDTIAQFGSKFSVAAGLLVNLRKFADQIGNRWIKGVTSSRAAFTSSRPQAA